MDLGADWEEGLGASLSFFFAVVDGGGDASTTETCCLEVCRLRGPDPSASSAASFSGLPPRVWLAQVSVCPHVPFRGGLWALMSTLGVCFLFLSVWLSGTEYVHVVRTRSPGLALRGSDAVPVYWGGAAPQPCCPIYFPSLWSDSSGDTQSGITQGFSSGDLPVSYGVVSSGLGHVSSFLRLNCSTVGTCPSREHRHPATAVWVFPQPLVCCGPCCCDLGVRYLCEACGRFLRRHTHRGHRGILL